MKIQITRGKIIDPHNQTVLAADLFIAAGKIISIDKAPQGFVPNRIIDAHEKFIIPGLVDLSARLREPGFEYLATLESEMLAASAGGVTSLVCPPDTDPPLDEPGLVEMLKHRAKGKNQTNVYPLGALTMQLKGERLTEMGELKEAGCIGFSQANQLIADKQVLLRAMDYAATFGFSVWLQPQDPYLSKGGVAHDGEVANRLGLPVIPSCAESVAIHTIIELMRETGARIHLCRISTAKAVRLIKQAKEEGLPITADVSINSLHLTEHDISYFDSNCHLIPPLRSIEDKEALRQGLKEGIIDVLVSDHSPVDEDVKQLPFQASEVGATGLELLLPLTLKWCNEEKIPLPQALSRVTSRPAEILGISAGKISVGEQADICVFDPEREWWVTPEILKSQGKNTPFVNRPLLGKVSHTIIGGFLIYEDARA
ncbi:MAG: dihydroorotase [Ferrovum sp. 21-44-67]|uniref:dihydroorotase n=1 Tax=Ferrovum sp. JA12 TaxID=1356299 RepID=UPI00070347C5|nr:dihydroorotase [Ferrovum sp. JA12]KRH79459.1 dihydroorotase [Ferrovum sp. JA12]OYV79570.1 MAG: dihydroorotase [Ferrovum sp. 21-44-67]HQT81490.1 dihydroorotase [Ferrovaceae bacterium]HQU06377.1 dihydroorotase [Ferrovaceae bacterium]